MSPQLFRAQLRAHEYLKKAAYDWLQGKKSLVYYAMRQTRSDAERQAVLRLLEG